MVCRLEGASRARYSVTGGLTSASGPAGAIGGGEDKTFAQAEQEVITITHCMVIQETCIDIDDAFAGKLTPTGWEQACPRRGTSKRNKR
ncbi:hypothetical protein CCU68_19800 [Pseudomonas gingeri NCPPB 3146 = LMG 5327]|uniref:Uncharacterized protein n=1 Tax=Pseudomonas gingeri NCPPB 3146 = LMG 5327 TaxID=707248 RepID=A0ABX4Y0F1_9PSED|nr:hypothetical protein CCU68_19800 [Pseudomonas gingeri NCPPB 3146 = LMG 5327]